MQPLVIQIENVEEKKADTCAFRKSPVRIGRNALNDLQLEEGFVSQWHAVVRFSEQGTTYLDLGSTNRTLVNGQPVERNVEVPIDESTDVRIGILRLHILRGDAPAELFGRRRASAFARVGSPEQGDLTRTMYLGDRDPSEVPPPPALATPGSGPAPAASAAPPPIVTPSVPVTPVSARPPQSTPSSPYTPSSAHPASGSGPPGAAPETRTPSGQPASAAAYPSTGDPLRDGYQACRQAWAVFFAEVSRRLDAVPAHQRADEVIALQQSYPQLSREPSFRKYLKERGVDPIRAGQPEMEDWLRRLTEGLFPAKGAPINIAMAMERVGEILEVFAQAFIELRRAHEQFCTEMALTRYADDTTLQRSDDPRVILAYLLGPTKEGAERTTELSRALADFALHQVALVSAAVEGARSMLETMSPDAINDAPDPPPQSSVLGEEGVMNKLWPATARKLWRRFAVMHHDLAEGDRFTKQLFGRAFARRYYSVTGGGGTDRRR